MYDFFARLIKNQGNYPRVAANVVEDILIRTSSYQRRQTESTELDGMFGMCWNDHVARQ